MRKSFLIRGGAFAADVRVKDGFITEIGKNLLRHDRERLVPDGEGGRTYRYPGAYITPGHPTDMPPAQAAE